MSTCSMSFLVSGIGSSVVGGKKTATRMYLNHTTAVMVRLWSTMVIVIHKYHDVSLVPSIVFVLTIKHVFLSLESFVSEIHYQ